MKWRSLAFYQAVNTWINESSPYVQLAFALSLFAFTNISIFVSPGPKSLNKRALTNIGSIIDIKGSAFVWKAGRDQAAMWVPLEVGDQVFKNQFVYANPQSSVRIKTKKDTLFVLEPETMLKLDDFTKTERVEVQKGEVSITLAQGSYLFLNEGALILADKASQVRIQKNPAFKPDLEVDRGRIQFFDPKNNQQGEIIWTKTTLEVGQSTILNKKISPPNTKTGRSQVDFDWSHESKDLHWTLEIADNPDFIEPIVRSQESDQTDFQASVPVGYWYWRLLGRRLYSTVIYESPTGEFEIREPKQIRFPATVMKEHAMRPSQIDLSYIPTLDRTEVTWELPASSSNESSRHDLNVKCSTTLNQQNFRALQTRAVLPLRDYVKCQLKIRSQYQSRFSKWSFPVLIEPEHVGI